jgi:hypothetical protein
LVVASALRYTWLDNRQEKVEVELQPLTLDYIRSLVPLDLSKIGGARPKAERKGKKRHGARSK